MNAAAIHAAAGVTVSQYAGEKAEWDAFVRASGHGTVFHLIAWKEVLEECFGFRAHYLVARRDREIVGVLPLFELGAALLGRSLLSLPFAVEGGVCSSDAEARAALETTAIELRHTTKSRYLELRDGLEADGFSTREGVYFGFRRPILPTDEENLAAIPRKQRRMVRVGQEKGLVASFDKRHIGVFHDLYARSVRNLGTPVFPQRYFESLLAHFPEDTSLLTIWHGEQAAAGVLSFFHGDVVLPYYSGSRKEYFSYAVNDLMYWELMRHARERGARVFDFGRSKKGTGAYAFKCHWGFEPQPLRYRINADAGAELAERNAADGRLHLLQETWRRLPLPLTKWMGPFIMKRYGVFFT